MTTTTRDCRHKRRWPAEVQDAINTFEREFGTGLSDLASTLADRIEENGLRANVQQVIREGIEDNREELSVLFQEGVENGAQAGRAMASRRFGLSIDFDVVPESTIEELRGVVDELEGDVFETLADGVASDAEDWVSDGMSVDDIAAELRSRDYADALDRRHTQTHARTLVQGAAERGNHSAMQDAPGVIGERWNVTADGRARDTHIAADGQIVPVDSTFVVGGSELVHPGDPGGAIEEVANCRCYATPVFEDDLTTDELAQLRGGQRLNV